MVDPDCKVETVIFVGVVTADPPIGLRTLHEIVELQQLFSESILQFVEDIVPVGPTQVLVDEFQDVPTGQAVVTVIRADVAEIFVFEECLHFT